MNKDLLLAGGVLVACLAIIVAASSEPSYDHVLDTDGDALGNGSEIARIDEEIPGVGQERQVPGLDEAFDIDESGDFDAPELGGTTPMEAHEAHGTTDTSIVDFGDEGRGSLVVLDAAPTTDDTTLVFVDETPRDFADIPLGTDTVETPLSSTGGDQIHTVVAGDILGTVSLKWYGTSQYWKEIRDANNVYENELQVGQRLIIPARAEMTSVSSSSPSTTSASPTTTGASAGQRSCVVQRGDSYYKIAQRELGDASRYKEIQALNATDAYDLVVGAQVLLPAQRSTTVVREATAPSAQPGAHTHTIAAHETLSDISTTYYGTMKHWRAIAAANGNIDPSRLQVGKKIQIPRIASASTGASSTASSPALTAAERASGSQTYTIKSGDRLDTISKKFYGSTQEWKRIQQANPGINPNNLRIGKVLVIPAGRQTTGATLSIPTRATDSVIDFGNE